MKKYWMVLAVFAVVVSAWAELSFYDPSNNPHYFPKGRNYEGAFISSSADFEGIGKKEKRTHRLKRSFKIERMPEEAHLFGVIDQQGEAYINGAKVLRGSYWSAQSGFYSVPSAKSDDILKALKFGENEIEVVYHSDAEYRGGAMLELFLRYGQANESPFERIVTDGNWTDETGAGVRCDKVCPNEIHPGRIQYRDYANISHCTATRIEPKTVVAGKKTHIAFELKNSVPPEGEFDICVMLTPKKGDGTVCWEEFLTLEASKVVKKRQEREWTLEFDWEAPLYFNDGDFMMWVYSSSIFCAPNKSMLTEMTISRAAEIAGYEKVPTAKPVKVGGQPKLFVNGEEYPALWNGVNRFSRPDKTPRMNDTKYTIATVYAYSTRSHWHPATGVYHWAYLDREAELTRRANPEAYFVFDISINPAKDFFEQHPEAKVTNEDGEWEFGNFDCWSYASEAALEEMKRIYRDIITYLESSSYANRIIGYRINSGPTIEWLGNDTTPGKVTDFSPAGIAAFKEFAAREYPELKDPQVPLMAERKELDSPNDILWERAKHLNAIAYTDYMSWICQRAAIACAKAARVTLEELGHRKLIGTYFGYTHYLNHNGCSHHRAHYRFEDFLSEADGVIDYLFSPYGYENRFPGEFMCDMKPFATLKAHNIIPVLEDDSRTHNRQLNHTYHYSPTCSKADTIEMFKKHDGIMLCRGLVPYHFALAGGIERDDKDCAALGSRMLSLLKYALAHKVGRHAEVALVASERPQMEMPIYGRYLPLGDEKRIIHNFTGEYHTGPRYGNVLWEDLFGSAQMRFAEAGAPVDLLLAEDLHYFAGDYKLYVFMNCFDFDERLLEAVKKIRERGATVLWMYAPGYLKANSLEDMKTLTGLDFTEIGEGTVEGSPDSIIIAKRFKAENRSGVANTWYFGGWHLPIEKIREVEAAAGVHSWCDSEDLIEANDAFVMFHSRSAGKKTIKLPQKAGRIIEVYSGETVAEETDSFSFEIEAFKTKVFCYR